MKLSRASDFLDFLSAGIGKSPILGCKTSGAGFSLIELLAAVTVLSVLMIILTMVTSTVNSAWLEGLGRVDNFTKARLALDLMARDLQSSCQRGDLPNFKNSSSLNDFAFYSERKGLILPAGTRGDRSFSYIRYKLEPIGADFQKYMQEGGLQRASLGYDFNDTVVFDATSFPPLVADALYPDGPYQQIGPGVVRWGVRYTDRKGELSQKKDHSGTVIARNVYNVNFQDPQNLENTAAVTVCVLVVHERALKLLREANKLIELETRFAEPSETELNDKSHRQIWMEKRNDSSWLGSLPIPARNGIQIFERRIILPGKNL